ncbi:MAG: ankyrin repeat domain-containing protein, partial [Pseudomonadota bacterium]|nr:ankyrin repeat domain-containing protein [Pseudomonadota bacterium]
SITVDFDRYDIFKLLIEYKTYNLRELGYALEKAAKMKKLQYIEHIVSSNLDLRNISEKVFEIMVYTLEHNHIDIFTIFFNLNIVNINKQDHKGASLLMIAAKNSNLDIMDDLISKGANIELTDANGCTAFMNAASDNNTIVMEKLLDFNCNIYTPDFDNGRPIQFIVCHDNYGILSRIITQLSPSDLVQDDLLNTCAELDLVEITKLICSRLTNEINFTNQEGETALFTAIDNNKIKISEILLQQNIDPNIISNNKWSPLQLVATKGNYEITKKILETGKVDINLASNEVNTPLYLAAKKGHTKICLELIKHGAYLEKTTNMNRTPLVTAIRHNKTETALQLLDAGALPNNRDNYNDGPLIFAASRGDITIIKKIIRLDRARELDSGNKNGETATYWAAKNGHSYVLKKLVESYNSINISDNNGITPLNSAIQNQQSSTAKFLLNLGADFSNKSSDGSPKISQLISMGISRSFLTDSIMDIANFSEEEKIEVIQVSANNAPQYSAFLNENNIFATTPPMTPPASPIQNIRKNMYNVL